MYTELKLWLVCNAVRNFPGVTSEDLYNVYGEFMGETAAFKVNVSDSTNSKVRKLLFSTFSSNQDLVEKAQGTAQFETSRK